jgi:hypothetical protein
MVVQSKTKFNNQSVWQINTRKSFVANALVERNALKQANRPIILITELHCLKGKAVFNTEGYTVFSVMTTGLNPRAAIAIPTYLKALLIHSLSDRDNVAIVIKDNTRTICLASVYLDIKYNNPVIGRTLHNIAAESERSGWDLLVGSDSNAHSLLWGSEKPNTRGDNVEEFLATHDLVIKNIGTEYTFVNSMHKTIIDITFTRRGLENHIANWAVNTSESHSDHKRIEYSLNFDSVRSIESRNYSKANWTLYGSIGEFDHDFKNGW